jgi:RNA polymerase sigma-70 factor (ECF subfamily)
MADELATLDDRTLLELSRGGDADRERAALALYERYKDEVYSFLLRLLGDVSLAEDAAQEAFYRLYRSLDRFDPERSFKPWLYQIVRNAGIDALRARKKERLMSGKADEGDLATEPGAVPDEASRLESIDDARQAILALGDESRALLLQRHGLGLDVKELAASFSCTERTIRNRLHAAGEEVLAVLARLRAGKGGRT